MENRSASQNLSIQGFFKLLELENKRWGVPAILDLFKHPLFLKKLKWEEKEIHKCAHWLKEANIRWGIDEAHCQALLKNSYEFYEEKNNSRQHKTTWEDGLGRLLDGLLSLNDEEKMLVSESCLIGQIKQVLSSLRADLSPFYDKTKMLLSQWSLYLKSVMEVYFVFDPSQERLFKHFDQLATLKAPLCERTFEFSSILTFLSNHLNRPDMLFSQKNFQSIRFSSLQTGCALPAKIVCLLGMNQEEFPRKEKLQALDKLRTSAIPNRVDFDRYLFLELFLSAGEQFWISYLGYSAVDGMEKMASTVVQELMTLLDQSYSNDSQLFSATYCVKHPLHAFEKVYFEQAHPLLKNYSHQDFCTAQSFYNSSSTPLHFFIPSLNVADHSSPSSALTERQVTIADLTRTLRYPLKSYFEKQLGIFLEEKSGLDTEDFLLSKLKSYQIKQIALKNSIKDLQLLLEGQGSLPYGIFGKAAVLRLDDEINAVSRFFEKQDIHPEHFKTISLVPQQKQWQNHDEHTILAPPVKITCTDSYHEISGKIENIHAQGLYFLYPFLQRNIARMWPTILVLMQLEPFPARFSKSFSCIDSAAHLTVPAEEAKQFLHALIDYHSLCEKEPSLMLPDWLDAISKKDLPGLKRKMDVTMQQEMSRSYDPYLHWLYRNHALPSAAVIIEKWHPVATRIFGRFFYEWFDK